MSITIPTRIASKRRDVAVSQYDLMTHCCYWNFVKCVKYFYWSNVGQHFTYIISIGWNVCQNLHKLVN